MSTVFVAVILVGIPALFIVLFTVSEKRKKQSVMNQLLADFDLERMAHKLAISQKEVLPQAIIGLDKSNRTLLVFIETHNGVYQSQLVDINNIQHCRIEKQFSDGDTSGFMKNTPEQHLKKITLFLERKSGEEPVEIDFYHHLRNDVYSIKEMKDKATCWENTLSGLIKKPGKITLPAR